MTRVPTIEAINKCRGWGGFGVGSGGFCSRERLPARRRRLRNLVKLKTRQPDAGKTKEKTMSEDRMTKEEIVASCIAAGQAIDIDWTGKVHTFGEKMPFGESLRSFERHSNSIENGVSC